MGTKRRRRPNNLHRIPPNKPRLNDRFLAIAERFKQNKLRILVGFILVGIATFITIMQGPSTWKAIKDLVTSYTTINVSLRLYNINGNDIQLSGDNMLNIFVNRDNILNNEIQIPLRLAIRNKEEADLEVVRAEITYDKSLQIRSTAQKIIHEEPGLITYEHSIGTLPVREGYTPLNIIDTLTLHHHFRTESFIFIAKDGIPMYVTTITGYDPKAMFYGSNELTFGVRVYSKNRKPFQGQIKVRLEPVSMVRLLYPPQQANGTTGDPLPGDAQLWSDIVKGQGYLLSEWSGTNKEFNFRIDYKKVQYQNGIYQLIFVNGIARRLNVDSDMDGFIDFELFDATGGGKPNLRGTWDGKLIMVDWSPDSIR